MASNRPHTWRDEYAQQQLAKKQDEQDAKYVLAKLWQKLGDDAYDSWVDNTVKDIDKWADIRRKAVAMLDCIARSEDEADYRQTIHDARPN